jgi:hypothetical protein
MDGRKLSRVENHVREGTIFSPALGDAAAGRRDASTQLSLISGYLGGEGRRPFEANSVLFFR